MNFFLRLPAYLRKGLLVAVSVGAGAAFLLVFAYVVRLYDDVRGGMMQAHLADARYIWMPVDIGDGKFAVPDPKEWTIDAGTGEAQIK